MGPFEHFSRRWGLLILLGNHLALHLLQEGRRGFGSGGSKYFSLILVEARAVFTAAENFLLLGVLEGWG